MGEGEDAVRDGPLEHAGERQDVRRLIQLTAFLLQADQIDFNVPFHSDYTQLGLPFNLFLPEIHFNLALCHIKQKDVTKGMYELRKASTRKMTPAHEVIEEAIEKRGEGFTVFSIVSLLDDLLGSSAGGTDDVGGISL